MPEAVTMSTGVSLGLLAGVVSGICYIIANGIAWPRSNHEGVRRCVRGAGGVCGRCGGDRDGGGIPCLCARGSPVKFESGQWFLRQAQKTLSLMPWSLSSEKLEQIDEESDGEENPERDASREELRNVREFLETLSARLAGGTLEGTRVAPLYHHPAYLPSRTSPSPPAHSAATSSSASGAHAQLKRLVARVVEEAAALPALSRYAAEPATPTDASTYEDLLATAILNKVIERYQTENGSGGRSSGIHSASASPTPSERSSPRSLHGRHNRDITPPLHEEEEDVSDWEEGEATVSDDALELPRRVPFPEFGGDIVHSTDNEERDFDEVSCSDIQAVDGSWEENWLFQKKKIKTLQSVPVPMLVPNSNTEYRALIGDRDADDTTDLSDNASDAEEEIEYKSDIKRVLDSKHVIGGQPKPEDDYEPDSLTIVDENININNFDNEDNEVIDAVNGEVNINSNKNAISDDRNDSVLVYGIDSGPIPKAEFNLKEEIHRTLMNGHADDFPELEEKMNGDVSKDVVDGFRSGKGSTTTTLSRHERVGEYEETFTLPVQRYADSLRRKHFDDHETEIPTRDIDNDELKPGTIAYRERKKWLNAVEMPNNPYSPEAIQKRLTAKSTSSLFDMITTKNNIDDDLTSVKSEVITRRTSKDISSRQNSEDNHKELLTLSVDNITNGSRSNSPSPKILKDVLAEEVPQYKRYGRDYYIREAKKSSGGRKKSSSETSSLSSMNHSTSLDNMDREFTSPGLLINQIKTIATNQHYTKFATKDETPEQISIITNKNKTDILIEYDDLNEQTLFSAKPVYVDDDTDKKFEDILQSAYSAGHSETNGTDSSIEPKSPNNLSTDNTQDNSYLSSSSMDDSIKIYNVPTGEIVKSKLDSLSEIYVAPDSNDNIDMPDKNISLDRFSINGDASEESLVIVENLDSLNSHKLDNVGELEAILPQLPKVKELAKKFVSMENLNEPVQPVQPIRRKKSKENLLNDMKADKPKAMYMHSLTARSISKEFRDELKLSMATPLKVPGGSKEIPEGEEVIKESSRPGSPLPEPGTIKTKLAFFESLKSKFSSK